MQLIKSDPRAFQYASEELKSDVDFALGAVEAGIYYSTWPEVFMIVSAELRDNRESSSRNPGKLRRIKDRETRVRDS